MKILLYSYVFSPRVGGVETVSQTLAQGFFDHGAECRVITETLSEGDLPNFQFKIYRNPDHATRRFLVEWADIVLFNGASLALQPAVWFKKKPFVWIHVGYQASCIDGLGWVEGTKAPITIWSSIQFHAKRSGAFYAFKEGLKLLLRNFVANHLVSKNIAITQWMLENQPLAKQEVIYNPFPLNKFTQISKAESQRYDFLYVGRLVSEKGVETLIRAFAQIHNSSPASYTLLIIGDGNRRQKLELLSKELKVSEFITFAGRKVGQELVDLVHLAPIAIVPSEWYEPMGGTALELISAGRAMIVSEYGGLKECVGDAGITFKNGDVNELAQCMLNLHGNSYLQEKMAKNRPLVLEKFNPDFLIRQYLQLFDEIINTK